MTISTTESRISYNGNGVTTDFSFPYRFLANGDLVVLAVSAAGVETVKTLTTDYTLTGAGDDAGGSVTMLVAPASGTRLVVYRETEVVQEVDYISGDPFPAETHERALDRLTMILQEAYGQINRSIRGPVTDATTLTAPLPAAALRLDKLVAFDSVTGAAKLSTFTQTQLALAVAATGAYFDIDFPTVRAHGAIADGTTDDRGAIAVADAAGHLNFGSGVYRVSSNITLTSDAYFFPGASLSIDSGVVVTFDGVITSPRQQIFSGAGTVLLNGEASRVGYPEWWGAFADDDTIDADVPLQKMSDAVVAGREMFVDFGPGTWYLSAVVSWSRACRIVGAGKRLTHFRCKTAFSTGDVFTTAEQGVAFEGIQFSSVTRRTSGVYINFAHNYGVARDVWFTDGFIGVRCAGNVCTVENVTGFNWSSAAGSCIVELADGFNTAGVVNIEYIDTGSNTPQSVVKIGSHTTFTIDEVLGRGCENVILITPASGTCGRGQIGRVIGQASITNCVYIAPTGTAAIEHIKFEDIYADAPTGSGLLIAKASSGNCKHLVFDSVRVRTPTGTGIKVSASSGRVDHFTIKSGFVTNGSGGGVDIANAHYWSISDTQCVTNAGTGTIIGNTCVGFNYSHNQNLFNTTANLTDSSGAVTKVVADNLVA